MGPATGAPGHGQDPGSDGIAKLAYVLLVLSPVVVPTALVAAAMAAANRRGAPAWLETHYRHLIRTALLGIPGAAGGQLLLQRHRVAGLAVLGFVLVWLVARCVKGLRRVGRYEPMPSPGSWLW